MKIENGSIINQYKIISAIGKGGMGEVFLAQDTKLDRKVALKILPPEFAEDADRMSRFVREAKSASALNHPNIITIYEIGESAGTHFIATEFIEGETLQNHLKGENISLKTVLDIATQIASALQTAHSAGIVHRDIKPDNVMIRHDGLAKILDFGIAKQSEPPAVVGGLSEDDATAIKPNSTSPGMIIGTANYMSPEQAKGKEIDARSDIFSFGIVFYEMLTGKRAFEGETALESISSILKDEPQPISQILPEVPSEIERIVSKTLRKDREERYQTAKDLLIDLKDAKQSLELQNLMERSIIPNQDENKTQILQATTFGEINQTTTNQTIVGNSKTKYLAAGLLALLLAVGGFFGYQSLFSTKQIESIAVMPFVNESKNEEVEYLSDGMTETLISSLSNIPNLSVKARSTVFYYKGKETSAKKIGEELKVQAVLLGRVSQRGDDLKLSLELVNTETLDAIWSETYNRKRADLVTLQTDIARDVSTKLKSKLSSAETTSLEKTYTTNAEAYQLYLQGRFHWNKRTKTDFEKAIGFFKQAIEKDPNYALAYAGLADTYALLPDWSDARPKDVMPQAKQAALKALQLDPNLAEAHASLALVKFYYDYDWTGAEQSYKRSIELNPKYPTARQWYGSLLFYAGRMDEGVREELKAVELDPFSKIIIWNLGDAFLYNGQYDEAIKQYQKVIDLFSDQRSNLYIGDTYAAQGNYQQAVEAYLNDYRFSNEIKPEEIQKLKEAFDKGGWESFGRLKQEIELSRLKARQAKDPNGYIKPIDFANAYSWGKDKDKVFEYLNKAYEDRSADILRLKIDLPFVFIRDDPRFKELVRKIGIPG